MNRIKDLRKQKGLTQEELGKLLNVQKAAVSKYELGRAVPSTDVLMKMAKIFGVTTDHLLGRPSSPSEIWKSILYETVYPPRVIAKQLGISSLDMSYLEHGKDEKISPSLCKLLLKAYQTMNTAQKVEMPYAPDIYDIIEDNNTILYKGVSYPLSTSAREKLHTAIRLALM